MATDRQQVRIAKTQGGLQISNAANQRPDLAAGAHLGRLLLGHGDPIQTIRSCNLHCPSRLLPLVAALFPEQQPAISPSSVF